MLPYVLGDNPRLAKEFAKMLFLYDCEGEVAIDDKGNTSDLDVERYKISSWMRS